MTAAERQRRRRKRMKKAAQEFAARPSTKDDRANQRIRKLLTPSANWINGMADTDYRAEFTADGRAAIVQAIWAVVDALGSVAQEIRDVDLEDRAHTSL
jgi:hypothetical protein